MSREPQGEGLLVALGRKGHRFQPPPGIRWEVSGPAQAVPEGPSGLEGRLRDALERPESGPAWAELVAGRRRVSILVGDCTLPALYDRVLPPLRDALVAAGIRPTRIGFIGCPGGYDRILGSDAIRRYDESIVGAHHFIPLEEWLRRQEGGGLPGVPGLREELCLGVFPLGLPPEELLPPPVRSRLEWVLGLDPGRSLQVEVGRMRAGRAELLAAGRGTPFLPGGALAGTGGREEDLRLILTSGGGAPLDLTLEEALCGLRPLPVSAHASASVILAFDGRLGLGSSRFMVGLWELLGHCESELAGAGGTTADAGLGGAGREVGGELVWLARGPWNPLRALWEVLRGRGLRIFSPGLWEQGQGEELQERLVEYPLLAGRFSVHGDEAGLWEAVLGAEGDTFQGWALPLGWRASVLGPAGS